MKIDRELPLLSFKLTSAYFRESYICSYGGGRKKNESRKLSRISRAAWLRVMKIWRLCFQKISQQLAWHDKTTRCLGFLLGLFPAPDWAASQRRTLATLRRIESCTQPSRHLRSATYSSFPAVVSVFHFLPHQSLPFLRPTSFPRFLPSFRGLNLPSQKQQNSADLAKVRTSCLCFHTSFS